MRDDCTVQRVKVLPVVVLEVPIPCRYLANRTTLKLDCTPKLRRELFDWPKYDRYNQCVLLLQCGGQLGDGVSVF